MYVHHRAKSPASISKCDPKPCRPCPGANVLLLRYDSGRVGMDGRNVAYVYDSQTRRALRRMDGWMDRGRWEYCASMGTAVERV
jgi:hypothetical protein